MKRVPIDFEDVASTIMFGKPSMTVEELLAKHRLVYRSGRDAKSIQRSIRLAYAKKTYKTEREIEWMGLYLKDVFKKYPYTEE